MIDHFFNLLNNNRLFGGVLMLLMNLGSKYISVDVPDEVEEMFQTVWFRRFFVFCVAFISTRDIKISIFITLLFVLVFNFLLNKKSKSSII
jgi:hypothetical protein